MTYTEAVPYEKSGTRDTRDKYDIHISELEQNIETRSTEQEEAAGDAQGTDLGWQDNKIIVNDLNTSIQERRKNYDTYKHAIEVEKTLYNRERHRTVLLSIANALALSGCLYVWLA